MIFLSAEYSSIFGFWPIAGFVLSALICLFLGSIFSPFFDSVIHPVLAGVTTIFRKKKHLTGRWTLDWHVDSSRFAKVNTTKGISLKQFNKNISAKYNVEDNDGNTYTYIVDGKIDNNSYVSGRWYDMYDGNTYHGTFVIHIDINMNLMDGYWIGTSQDKFVKCGKMEWRRD